MRLAVAASSNLPRQLLPKHPGAQRNSLQCQKFCFQNLPPDINSLLLQLPAGKLAEPGLIVEALLCAYKIGHSKAFLTFKNSTHILPLQVIQALHGPASSGEWRSVVQNRQNVKFRQSVYCLNATMPEFHRNQKIQCPSRSGTRVSLTQRTEHIISTICISINIIKTTHVESIPWSQARVLAICPNNPTSSFAVHLEATC